MNITPPPIPTYIQSTKQKPILNVSNISNPLHSTKVFLLKQWFSTDNLFSQNWNANILIHYGENLRGITTELKPKHDS